jgi:hypothetical protein
VRFRRFVDENPSVVTTIVRLARERKAAGHTRWSIRGALELLRERPELITGTVTVPGGRRVAIDNSFGSLMSRLVMAHAPDLDGFFKTR